MAWTQSSELAMRPRWSLDDTLALSGQCRGRVLRDWAELLDRRFGSGSAAALRERLGLGDALPDAPDLDAWYPVGFQLAITEDVAIYHLDGDLNRLTELLENAGARTRDKVVKWAARRAGPKRILANAPRVHKALYTPGQVTVDIQRREATLTYSGAAMIHHPTWQVMQLTGLRAMLRVLNKDLLACEGRGTETSFQARIHWR